MKNPANWNLNTAQAWSVALTDLGITQSEFALACQKSLSQEWFPTAPFDFLALARQGQASQYPDMRQAYLDSANQKYLHCVAYETASRVGFYEMKSQSENITWKHWQEVYPIVCDEHKNGAVFTMPESHQLEHKHFGADKAVTDNAMNDILAKLGRKKAVSA